MPEEKLLAHGMVEKIGEETSNLKHEVGDKTFQEKLNIPNHQAGLELIVRYLIGPKTGIIKDVSEIEGIGHRVVHGGEGFDKSIVIDAEVLKKIEDYKELAPLHNPHNLSGIYAAQRLFPTSIQVASFDTAFHTTLPETAYLYAIPYEFYQKYGIRRYGFHGTSHRYVARRAAELLGKGKYELNAITCHLGNGCSIAAVRNGRSVDTSMGLTPLEGLVMGTRSGDIDPGVILHFGEHLGLDWKKVNKLLNKESGLLGVSGISNDFRNLLEGIKKGNKRASLAVDIFCYRIKKYIGSYLAVLGKIDAVVFTAGIGENVPLVREKSLSGLENFGLILDKNKNEQGPGERIISAAESKIAALVIPTDEELRIAFDTYKSLQGANFP